MKKMLCALLALVLMLSLLPLSVSAAETATVTVTVHYAKDLTETYTLTVGDEPVELEHEKYVKATNKRYYEFQKYSNNKKEMTIPAYDGTTQWLEDWGEVDVYYFRHTHNYQYRYNRKGHWQICACGYSTKTEDHVDPVRLTEKVCICGYKFSDNCDLTTLWLADMRLTEAYDREKTDYIAEVFVYQNKDVTKTSITARTFDALATVQLPTDLTVKDTPTTFEIVVTAEDGTTTKTYTVIAVKPVTVEDHLLFSDGTSVSTEVASTTAKRVATATVPEAVLTEMAALAVRDEDTQITLEPDFNIWHNEQVDTIIPFGPLAESKTDLVVKTSFGTVTIPNAQLLELMKDAEAITVTMLKDGTCKLLVDGKEVTDIAEEVTVALPEKP